MPEHGQNAVRRVLAVPGARPAGFVMGDGDDGDHDYCDDGCKFRSLYS